MGQSRKPLMKIKKLFTFTIILFSLMTYSQDFEGKIEYKITCIKNNKEVIDSPEFIKFIGDKSTFITKRGSYKQITNSSLNSFQLYDPNKNKLYLKNNRDSIESDTLFFVDVSKMKNTNFEYEIIKNADTILGHICNKLIIKAHSNVIQQDYYYSSDLKLNSKYFKNFTAFDKNKITDIMKSVFLKLDFHFNDFTLNMTAIDIQKIAISDTEFTLPPHKLLIKKTD